MNGEGDCHPLFTDGNAVHFPQQKTFDTTVHSAYNHKNHPVSSSGEEAGVLLFQNGERGVIG